ncbi:hypothetical protein AAFF_G00183510 [Aldrovandia affinis]|uniref:C1q domain-containing protein n=1 Tax=Aldrovandia affinis TaxID=143900 RepID=A0AAD7RK56_9TELE|nr:hypothetical protein AAFF_G00183510 [Aldrovandia affinis]
MKMKVLLRRHQKHTTSLTLEERGLRSGGTVIRLVLLCLFGTVLGSEWSESIEWPESEWSESEEPDQDDDPKAGSLDAPSWRLMLKQIHQLTKSLRTALTALNNTCAHRSVFSVQLSDNPTCFKPRQVDDVVTYTDILLNVGGGYSESRGVFTAPLQGLYSLAVTVYTTTGTVGHSCATLQKNGVVLASTTGDRASLAVVVYLKAGDTVLIFLSGLCKMCGTQNTFTGFLLYADD